MDLAPRTLLRIFLLIGGIVFLGTGVLDDDLAYMALGVIAIALGAFGLWWEYSQE